MMQNEPLTNKLNDVSPQAPTPPATVAPSLEEWLGYTSTERADIARSHHLSVLLALDGSVRYYLLRHPNEKGEITDFDHYADTSALALWNVLDKLFESGFETVLVLNVWPDDIERRHNHLQDVIQASQDKLMGDLAYSYYRKWRSRVRLYGNYDIHPVFAPVREALTAMRSQLHETTDGAQMLLYGYSAGGGLDEIIARSINLNHQLGTMPSQAELRAACFPDGPEQIDVFINAGWMRAQQVNLPPVLNGSGTDIYFVSHLTHDLTDHELALILYDKLFRRGVVKQTDVLTYDQDTLAALRAYYDQNSNHVTGLGELVGSGLWYPV